jgi:hypothetical protein
MLSVIVLTVSWVAEMAFVTLQGTEINSAHGLIQGSHPMWLSVTVNPVQISVPEPNVHPIFVSSDPSLLPDLSGRQHRYKEFRAFGPLVSVQLDVDVGLKERGDVVQLWDEGGAQAAIKHVTSMGNAAWIKVLNTTSIKITVRGIYMCVSLYLSLIINRGSPQLRPSRICHSLWLR